MKNNQIKSSNKDVQKKTRKKKEYGLGDENNEGGQTAKLIPEISKSDDLSKILPGLPSGMTLEKL